MRQDPPPPAPRHLRRALLVATGCVALCLGTLGIVLPLLPATPFVLLAAACFAGAWPAMHRRLGRSRLFGPMLRAGPGARYLPQRTKLGAIAFTLVSVGATIGFAVQATWLRVVLGAMALGVCVFLARMPSRPR